MTAIETSSKKNTLAFTSLKLRDGLFNNLETLGYNTMTPIQAQSLPIMLKKQDVIAQAKTGSGKTAAFGLSILNQLQVDSFAVQALILCPTRELAEQVAQALRQLARLMPNVKILNLSGGMPMKAQLDSLRHSAHIIVGTPGRIKKHLDKETLTLHKLKTLVLDEADRMLDMGFLPAMTEIVAFCPKARQTLLFSATYPVEIKKLSQDFMQSPQRIIIEEAHTELHIEQIFYKVGHQSEKFDALKILLLHHQPLSTLIFCNTKEQTSQLASKLRGEGFNALALNGDMEQEERDLAIILFKNQSCSILVATDVAARGLDIKELPAVVNFDLAFEQDSHIHRIGRTGRAGSKGLAISFATSKDGERLQAIEQDLKRKIAWGDVAVFAHSGNKIFAPEMVTLELDVGRKDKIRPGDILGALTKDGGLDGKLIGKIDITPYDSYVAIHKSLVTKTLAFLKIGKLKGFSVKVRRLK